MVDGFLERAITSGVLRISRFAPASMMLRTMRDDRCAASINAVEPIVIAAENGARNGKAFDLRSKQASAFQLHIVAGIAYLGFHAPAPARAAAPGQHWLFQLIRKMFIYQDCFACLATRLWYPPKALADQPWSIDWRAGPTQAW